MATHPPYVRPRVTMDLGKALTIMGFANWSTLEPGQKWIFSLWRNDQMIKRNQETSTDSPHYPRVCYLANNICRHFSRYPRIFPFKKEKKGMKKTYSGPSLFVVFVFTGYSCNVTPWITRAACIPNFVLC